MALDDCFWTGEIGACNVTWFLTIKFLLVFFYTVTLKDTLKAFDDLKKKQQKCMK